MAYDVLNLSEVATTGTTGYQNLGDLLVNTGGVGVVGTGCQVNSENRTTFDISKVSSKYDARFDDKDFYV